MKNPFVILNFEEANGDVNFDLGPQVKVKFHCHSYKACKSFLGGVGIQDVLILVSYEDFNGDVIFVFELNVAR